MRRFSCILFLLILSFFVWAADPDPVLNVSASTALEVSAFMGTNFNVSVVPDGNDFDLMGSDVWWRSGRIEDYVGRKIATWSLKTNKAGGTISITATPLIPDSLAHAPEDVKASNAINYRLSFGLYVSKYEEKNIVVFSKDVNNLTQEIDLGNLPVLASTDQSVRLFLVKINDDGTCEQYTNADRMRWMTGNYTANVTITITEGSTGANGGQE